MTMAQDMDMDITVDGAAALPGLGGPMKMVMRMTMGMTQKVGPLKPDGSVDADVTYDEVKAEMSMNGQTFPTGDVAGALSNVTVTTTFNRNGEIIAIKGLPAGGPISDDAFKQMMASFYGGLPTEPIAVGGLVTTPMDIALPLPLPGAGPMKMVSSTKTKLVAIENGPQGRSARLESSTDGKMQGGMPSPDGKGSLKFDFILSGGGTSVMDLTRGVLRTSITTTNMNGTLDLGTAAPAGTPPVRMRMTMTVTIAGN